MLQPQWFILSYTIVISLILKCVPYMIKIKVIPMEVPSYLWSFSPEMALSIYCGLFLRHKPWMLAIPLGLRILSDILLAYLNQEWIYLFYPTQLITYTCLTLLVFTGMFIPKSLRVDRVILTSLGAAILFFLLTNGSIWLCGDRHNYPYAYDVSGLIECYTLALPFFRNSLISTVFFSCLLCSPFGVTLQVNSNSRTIDAINPEGAKVTA